MTIKSTVAAAFLLGIVLFTGVLFWQGAGEIADALAGAGWGLLIVAAWHLVPLVLDTLGWHALYPAPRPGFMRLLWARWIGESVNGLLPVAQIGGDIAKARLLVLKGRHGATAGASVVTDTTLGMITQILFALLGVVLLLQQLGQHHLVPILLLGVAGGGAMSVWFYKVQRAGMFAGLARALQKVAGSSDWLNLVGGAEALDAAISNIYDRRRAVLKATVWRMLGWLLGAGEVWLALYFLDSPVSWSDALLIEALGQAVRGAAFIIPAALGVQEGGYLLLGTMLGLTPDVSLALALAKRVRELLFGLPGLVAWQWAEGRQLHARRRDPCKVDP